MVEKEKRPPQRHETAMSEKLEESDDLNPKRQMLRLSEIPCGLGDVRLRKILPLIDEPYHPQRFTNRELNALREALGDGFGSRGLNSEPFALPPSVQSGLLNHAYHADPNSDYGPRGDGEEEFWTEDLWTDEEFWTEGSEDQPAPCTLFPLGFHTNGLHVYFRNQFDRYCYHLSREDAAFAKFYKMECEEEFADFARMQFYEKPWYELHALQFLDWIKDPDVRRSIIPIVHFYAGQLGRLVEQYFWRFQYEPALRTGLSARDGASAGGKALALMRQNEKNRWQAAADSTWVRRPGLKNIAVAEIVKKELKVNRTAKHIARYLRRPHAKK